MSTTMTCRWKPRRGAGFTWSSTANRMATMGTPSSSAMSATLPIAWSPNGRFAKALGYADDIIATLREPFVVLDGDLRVKSANRAFYEAFHVLPEETENHSLFDLENGQWDIPILRELLAQVLSNNESVHDFEVEHVFPGPGSEDHAPQRSAIPPELETPGVDPARGGRCFHATEAGRRTGRGRSPQGRVSWLCSPTSLETPRPHPKRRSNPATFRGKLGMPSDRALR